MVNNEIILFESSDGAVVLDVNVDVEHEDVWLNRNQLAQLFDRDVKTIGKHVNNALKEELAGTENRTVAKFATTTPHGVWGCCFSSPSCFALTASSLVPMGNYPDIPDSSN